MESRAFIKAAAVQIEKIQRLQQTIGTADELQSTRENIQGELNQLFRGLQNPTLPSAYRLRDTAQRAGFWVDPKVLQNLAALEYIG